MPDFRLAALVATFTSVRADENPVQKVITLLGDMQSNVEENMNLDMEASRKLQCWASDTAGSLETAIDASETSIRSLTGEIEANTGRAQELTKRLAQTETDITNTQSSLKGAEQKRTEEATVFRADNLDYTTELQGLESAILVLKKHQSFAQVEKTISKLNASHPKRALLQEAQRLVSEYKGDGTTGNMAYSAQSGEIYGILSQMLDDMKRDHAQAEETEAAAASSYSALKNTLTEKLSNLEQSLTDDRVSLTNAQHEKARAESEKTLISNELTQQKSELEEVKAKARADQEESAKRLKMYNEELRAITETIDILTSFEMKVHMAQQETIPVSFVQVSRMGRQSDSKTRAAKVLSAQGSPKLALIASMIPKNPFDIVLTEVTKLIDDLTQSKKNEVSQRDTCISQLHENEVSQNENTNLLADLAAKIESIKQSIANLNTAISEKETEIKDADFEFARATNDRVTENANFAKLFNDNVISKRVLGDAVFRLEQFYKNNSFLQTSDDPPAGAGLSEDGYKANSSGGSAIMLINQIIADSESTVNEARTTEQERQALYESLVKSHSEGQATNKAILAERIDEKANEDKNLAATTKKHKGALEEHEQLVEVGASLHGECDFLLENFSTRQDGYSGEIEALKSAEQILKGMDV